MRKVAALLSTLLLVFGTQVFAADAAVKTPKIAVVNVQQVLLQSTRVADVNTKLQNQFKPRQEKLSSEQKSLQEQVDKYTKESATMSQKDREAAEKKIGDEKADFLKQAADFQKEVQQEQNKSMQTILSQLSNVIADQAKKGNFSLVLDSQAVVYPGEATDITKLVAKTFNKGKDSSAE